MKMDTIVKRQNQINPHCQKFKVHNTNQTNHNYSYRLIVTLHQTTSTKSYSKRTWRMQHVPLPQEAINSLQILDFDKYAIK